jgi:hypothetical protein
MWSDVGAIRGGLPSPHVEITVRNVLDHGNSVIVAGRYKLQRN